MFGSHEVKADNGKYNGPGKESVAENLNNTLAVTKDSFQPMVVHTITWNKK